MSVRDNIIVPVSGQFFLDNPAGGAEVNGWGDQGPSDNTNQQDLGNTVDYPTLNRRAGGLVFPEDMQLVRFYAWHRINNTDAADWGWVITRLQKTAGSNTQTGLSLYSEIGSYNVYGNTQNQLTDVTTFTNNPIPAGQVVNLAVAVDPAFVGDTNRNVQVQAGYMEFAYVNGFPTIE